MIWIGLLRYYRWFFFYILLHRLIIDVRIYPYHVDFIVDSSRRIRQLDIWSIKDQRWLFADQDTCLFLELIVLYNFYWGVQQGVWVWLHWHFVHLTRNVFSWCDLRGLLLCWVVWHCWLNRLTSLFGRGYLDKRLLCFFRSSKLR
jgi:hypothetical protein